MFVLKLSGKQNLLVYIFDITYMYQVLGAKKSTGVKFKL